MRAFFISEQEVFIPKVSGSFNYHNWYKTRAIETFENGDTFLLIADVEPETLLTEQEVKDKMKGVEVTLCIKKEKIIIVAPVNFFGVVVRSWKGSSGVKVDSILNYKLSGD